MGQYSFGRLAEMAQGSDGFSLHVGMGGFRQGQQVQDQCFQVQLGNAIQT